MELHEIWESFGKKGTFHLKLTINSALSFPIDQNLVWLGNYGDHLDDLNVGITGLIRDFLSDILIVDFVLHFPPLWYPRFDINTFVLK